VSQYHPRLLPSTLHSFRETNDHRDHNEQQNMIQVFPGIQGIGTCLRISIKLKKKKLSLLSTNRLVPHFSRVQADSFRNVCEEIGPAAMEVPFLTLRSFDGRLTR
jgi:hypothetical protein